MNSKIIFSLLFVTVLAYYLFLCNRESFANIPFLGYQDTPNFTTKTSFINYNRPDNTDWNLFMLVNKFRFQSVLPFFKFSHSPSVYPPNNLPTSPNLTPVLLVPGLGDCLLKSNNKVAWPPKNADSFEALKEDNLLIRFDNNNSNMTPFIDTLKGLKYTKDTMSVQPYDFRNICEESNLIELFKRIKESIVRLYKYSGLPVVLVGQDLGCTLLSLFLNRQQETFLKEYVKEFVCVGSVFGGSIQGVTDYVNGIPQFDDFRYMVRNFDGLKLKLPNKLIFHKTPVIYYGDTSYTGNQLHNLFEFLDISPDDTFYELQKESLNKPLVKVTFINNKIGHEHHKELYEYWNPSIFTTNIEGSKLFNNYDVVLNILKRLDYLM